MAGSPARDEAEKVAGALVLAVLDEDTEGASVLLTHSSHQVIAQAATDLARWITYLAGDDPAAFRAQVAAALQRATSG
jgi:hypothetical protein